MPLRQKFPSRSAAAQRLVCYAEPLRQPIGNRNAGALQQLSDSASLVKVFAAPAIAFEENLQLGQVVGFGQHLDAGDRRLHRECLAHGEPAFDRLFESI